MSVPSEPTFDLTTSLNRPEQAAGADDVPATRGRRRRRIIVGALSATIVAVLLLAALVIPTGSDHRADTGLRPQGERSDHPRKLDVRDDGLGLDDTTTSSSMLSGSLGSTGRSSLGMGGSAGSVAVEPPRLETITDIVLDPGIYERDLVLRNTGGSPLSFSAGAEGGDVVSPSAGVIPAGGQVLVHLTADEYADNSKHWTHTVVVHSDGGDAQVEVQGTTLLPPMPQIVGGTFVDHPGNVFVFGVGAINGGIEVKNEGDLPLDISFSTAAHGRVLGGPAWQIEGGQTQFVGFSICGVPAPPVATAIEFEVYIDAGSYGVGTVVMRFNLNAGQLPGPC